VVLEISRSIRERLSGGGEVAGAGDAVGKGAGGGSKSEGLGKVGVGGCGVVGGIGFGACSSGRSMSVGVLTGLSSTVLGGSMDVVVGLLGGSGSGSEWGGGVEGGVGVGVGICGVGAGEYLAGWCQLRRSCQLLSTGFLHRDAVVEFGGCFVECVGGEVGWFSVWKGFGVDGIGSCSSEWRSAQRSSYKVANAQLSASLG